MSQECDKSQCPICGKPNLCQMEECGECWCAHLEIPPELLESVPPELKMKACICRGCVERAISLRTGLP